MPKAITTRKTSRATPYPIATTPAMSTQVAHGYSIPTHAQTPTDWPSGYPYYPQHNLMPQAQTMPAYVSTPHVPQASASPQPAQSGPWTNDEDDILCDYRTRGYGWNQIHEQHFPHKSSNACRKRHERLMSKRRSTEWNDNRLDNLAIKYREMKEQMWSALATELGEKWEDVEKAAMQQGLKALKNRAANHSRHRSSGSSKRSSHRVSGSEGDNSWAFPDGPDNNDDSGIAMGSNNGNRPTSGEGGMSHGWQETVLQQAQQRESNGHAELLRDPEVARQFQPTFQHPHVTLGQDLSPYHPRENSRPYVQSRTQ